MAELPRRSCALELVRRLDGWRGVAELYRRGGAYIVVSTIDDGSRPQGGWQREIAELCEAVGEAIGHEYPATGEETMAFVSEESGAMVDKAEITRAFGDGSRARVLAEMGGA